MDDRDAWVTQVEAARRLGCSPSHVQTLLRRGQLVRRPGPRDRGTPSVGAASVDELAGVLEEQRAARAAAAARRAVHGSPPDDEHVWLDTDETAAVLGLSRPWVKARARQGRIPATKYGGKWWVRREHAEQIAAVRAAALRHSRA
ncbi:hypothetical protein GCM10009737_08530 [Nocardioides lentus]|uniref:Helix-turn-helix domain-containing protein n=1 Tax=Nocardioides lentus TaxID=338077 RepID=A0ABP5AE97_9ACTN